MYIGKHLYLVNMFINLEEPGFMANLLLKLNYVSDSVSGQTFTQNHNLN